MCSPTSASDKANNNKQMAPVPFQAEKFGILSSKSGRYLVLDFIGEGCFGKVTKCVNLETSETTAIKIHKKREDHIIQREVGMLEELRALDPEKKNLVRFIDSFMSQNLSCLAFEMLDRSLWNLMKERKMPLTLNEIRPITHQLLVAFEALKSVGIIHTDLKPDNIMLVNHQDQPFRVKLIDFGLALPASEVTTGMTLQARAYRAPEVTLGLPISEAIDMWGLGCVIAYLYFGINLFPGKCAYHSMKAVCHLLGQPGDHLLSAGKNTWQYFSKEEGSTNPGWRLKTPEEYKEVTSVEPKTSDWVFDTVGNLDEAVQAHVDEQDYAEYKDKVAFSHLLKRLLRLDAEKRITPEQALKHPFITMEEMEDMDTSSYADAAFELMTVCPLDDSDESDYSLSDSEADIETTDSSDEVSSTDSDSDENTDPRAYYYDPPTPDCRTGLRRETSGSYSGEDDIKYGTIDSCDEDGTSADDSYGTSDTDSSCEEEWGAFRPHYGYLATSIHPARIGSTESFSEKDSDFASNEDSATDGDSDKAFISPSVFDRFMIT